MKTLDLWTDTSILLLCRTAAHTTLCSGISLVRPSTICYNRCQIYYGTYYNNNMLLCYPSLLPLVEADPLYYSFISTSISVCGEKPWPPDTDILSHHDDNESTVDAPNPSSPPSLNDSCSSDSTTGVSFGIAVCNQIASFCWTYSLYFRLTTLQFWLIGSFVSHRTMSPPWWTKQLQYKLSWTPFTLNSLLLPLSRLHHLQSCDTF